MLGLLAVALLVSSPATADPVCAHTPKAHACGLEDGSVAVKVGQGPWIRHAPLLLDEADPQGAPSLVSFDTTASVVAPAVIDLLVVWTPAARSAWGGTDAITALARLIEQQANTTYAHHGLPVTLRLVAAQETPYVESGDANTDLNRVLSAKDGFLDAVPPLRDVYGADVTLLLVSTLNACGIAMLGPDAPFAYGVVPVNCVGGLSAVHEIGHMEGMGHDRAAGCRGWFSYSCGYVDPACKFRDVMSYGGCPRVSYFSTPLLTLNGSPLGDATTDNAQTLALTAAKVAAFRAPVLTPPPVPISLARVM